MDQLSKTDLVRIESRLTNLDAKVDQMKEDVGHVRERSNVWDSFQHHVSAWADLMTSIDGKVDHMAR